LSFGGYERRRLRRWRLRFLALSNAPNPNAYTVKDGFGNYKNVPRIGLRLLGMPKKRQTNDLIGQNLIRASQRKTDYKFKQDHCSLNAKEMSLK